MALLLAVELCGHSSFFQNAKNMKDKKKHLVPVQSHLAVRITKIGPRFRFTQQRRKEEEK